MNNYLAILCKRSHVLATAGLIAAFVWSFMRSGPSMLSGPETGVSAARAWPQRLDGEFTAFISDSPLGLLLFKALDSTLPQAWVLMHLVTAIIVMWMYAAWALMVSAPNVRFESARLVLLAPVSAVLFTSLGSYDPFTLLSMLVVLLALLGKSRVVMSLSGMLLGFQHFEQGLLSLLALIFVWLGLKAQIPPALTRVSPAWSLIGLALGKLLLSVVFLVNDVTQTGRPQWLLEFLVDWSITALTTAPLLLWSLFAGMWVSVLYVWLMTPRNRSRVFLVSAFLLGLLGLLVSGDRPRVFIVILAPALALVVVAYTGIANREKVSRRLIEVVVWISPPIMFAETVVTNVNVVDIPYTLFLYLTG